MERADLDQLADKELADKEVDCEQNTQANLHEEGPLPRDVYALLAQANLLRMRGHWEEAAEACMTALRLAPDSSSANSLLGDIYENQGRYDDAAQWYRMALDANPDSPADSVKLERLSQRENIRPGQSRPGNAGIPKASSGIPKAVDTALTGHRVLVTGGRVLPRFRDPEFVLRWGAAAATLALVLVVALAFHAVHHAGTLAALGFGGDPVVKSSLVVVPPRAGTLPVDPDAAPLHDPSEQSLLTALQASQDLSRLGVAVYDVQADPRAGRMTITFGLTMSSDLTQAAVVRDALRVLEAAGSDSSVTTYTARCLLMPSSGSAGTALAFVGDVSSASVQASASAGTALTDTQAEAAFSNLWWSSTADIPA